MRLFSLSAAVAIACMSIPSNAEMLETAKEYGSKAMFWKSSQLANIGFEDIYPKSFYKKSYFGYTLTGATIIGAGAFTYFTAGAGAPAAVAGTSAVASWVSGSSAGSYMAGLSSMGSLFGGNAVLGATIMNGISKNILGSDLSSFASLSTLSKIDIIDAVTASALDGVANIGGSSNSQLQYEVNINIPKNLGSDSTREIVDKLYELDEEINEATKSNDPKRQTRLYQLKDDYSKDAVDQLKNHIGQKESQEDLVVLGIIAWNNHEYELFGQAVNNINVYKMDDTGFLNYLFALKSLQSGDKNSAISYLENSIDENSYAIEPILLYINLLGDADFVANEQKIELLCRKAEEKFDSDQYSSKYSLVAVYYRMGRYYFANKRYVKARQYYEKAEDQLGVMQKYLSDQQLRHTIRLNIANSFYQLKQTENADDIYRDILEDSTDTAEQDRIKAMYLGNKSDKL